MMVKIGFFVITCFSCAFTFAQGASGNGPTGAEMGQMLESAPALPLKHSAEPGKEPQALKKYPHVSFVKSGKGKNDPKAINFKEADQPQELKKNDVLTEHARIVTSGNAEVKIELDAFSSVTVFADSELQIPVITWGVGEAHDLRLLHGKIRISCEKNCVRNFTTPLSQNVFTNGVLLLEYHPESPYVEVTVLHGAQDFRGLENEEQIRLEAGQKSAFQGLKENGEVAYDVLLKGRKVARGKLQPAVTLKPEELAALDASTKASKPAIVVVKKVIPRLPGQICDAPFGELNQCAWTCEGFSKRMKSCDSEKKGVSCVRRRCNANGQWGDPAVQSSLGRRCELQPIVAACDY